MANTAHKRKAKRDAAFIAEAAYCKENGHRRYGCDTSITVMGRSGKTLMPKTQFAYV